MNDVRKVQGNLKRVKDKGELISSLKDYLDIALLNQLQTKSEYQQFDKTFHSNEDFWLNSIQNNLFAGQIIKLEKFKILEWIPSSPGLFYTPHAENQRRDALESHRQWRKETGKPSFTTNIELRPSEKMGMVQGGYGSLRVAPKFINNELQHIVCASSTGISHEGLAITLKQQHYTQIIERIRDGKTPIANIIGRLMILPNELSPIKLRYDAGIPKFYLDIQELEIIENTSPENAVVSVAITYSKKLDYLNSSSFSYSFYSFSPSKNNEDLKEAVTWLQNYAVKYSKEDDPIIVGDFDEEYNHFDNVVFPIQEIAKGNIPIDKLMYFKELFNLQINELYMGDKIQVGDINNNSGQIIIGKDITISNSHNERKEIADKIDELLKLLKQENIEDNQRQTLITNFDKVKEEITDEEQPSKSKIFKWLSNTKKVVENLVLANHTREAIHWIYENFHFLS